jgi:hypothetical protein
MAYKAFKVYKGLLVLVAEVRKELVRKELKVFKAFKDLLVMAFKATLVKKAYKVLRAHKVLKAYKA